MHPLKAVHNASLPVWRSLALCKWTDGIHRLNIHPSGSGNLYHCNWLPDIRSCPDKSLHLRRYLRNLLLTLQRDLLPETFQNLPVRCAPGYEAVRYCPQAVFWSRLKILCCRLRCSWGTVWHRFFYVPAPFLRNSSLLQNDGLLPRRQKGFLLFQASAVCSFWIGLLSCLVFHEAGKSLAWGMSRPGHSQPRTSCFTACYRRLVVRSLVDSQTRASRSTVCLRRRFAR